MDGSFAYHAGNNSDTKRIYHDIESEVRRMMRLLVVEDEKGISDFIRSGVSRAGFECDCAFDGQRAADMIDRAEYDLILLDVMLPKVDGFELMGYIAPLGVPVIFITARSDVRDRVKGLRLGADDYIIKPFEMIELLARMDAVLRRHHKGSAELTLGDVTVNLDARSVEKGGQSIALKAKEFDLLVFLMRNRDTALFRETIYEHVWQGDYTGDTRTIDLHVLRLRKKLDWEDRLVTLNRIGYRLNSK